MDKIEGLIMILVMSHQMGIIELLKWCQSIQKWNVIVVEIVNFNLHQPNKQLGGWNKLSAVLH